MNKNTTSTTMKTDTADEHVDVVEICRQLDGVPIAIELAAAIAASSGVV